MDLANAKGASLTEYVIDGALSLPAKPVEIRVRKCVKKQSKNIEPNIADDTAVTFVFACEAILTQEHHVAFIIGPT
jgi:5-hydroxyisourate hydrolase-like protein (transthyretin family)